MRIALRTGAGRGVYELAGSQGGYQASDLFGRELYYELTPDLVIPGRAIASISSGKPRIKLDEQKRTTHLYRLLAGVLLLPKPKREFKTTHGQILVTFESYSMTAIKVDVSSVANDRVIVRPTDLLLENADHISEKVKLVDRMARIVAIWERSENIDSQLAGLLRQHKACVFESDPDYKRVEACSQGILDYVGTIYDPMPAIETALGIDLELQSAQSEIATGQTTHQAEFGIDDAVSPSEAQIENIRQWRQVAVRGAAATRFRSLVTDTYQFRCLFSGHRLPKTEATDSAGVDAAHILPWSTHNINKVSNGLCLNKLCHWAFDAGVLKLSHDSSKNRYVIEIPAVMSAAALKAHFDLEYFKSLTGTVPISRLPAKQADWPSPAYLADLNRIMFG